MVVPYSNIMPMLYEQWDYRPVRGCELIAECETSPQISALQGGYDNRAGCNDCQGETSDLSEPSKQRVDSVK